MVTVLGPVSLLLAYLLGSLPFGYLLVKQKTGEDIRGAGSGSIGATNVTRALGLGWGFLTLALDVGKGYLAVLVAAQISGGNLRWVAAAGLAAILGHSFPVFLRFRGGKSVATGVGVFAYFTPWALLATLGVWVVVVALWRYVSLGSVLATAVYPLLAFALYRPPLEVTLAGVAGACLILVRHRSNLQRLVSGTENKLTWRRKD